MKKLLMLVAIATSISLMGCQEEEKQPEPKAPSYGSVAVFDINKVAFETGLSQGIDEKLAQRDAALNKELKQFQENLKKQLKKEVKKLKKKDRKKKVVILQRAAQAQFNKARRKAVAILKNYQVKLVGEAREKIRPVAKEVAHAKGFKVILLRNESVVYDAIDEVVITDEVLARFQQKYPDAKRKPEPEKKVNPDKVGSALNKDDFTKQSIIEVDEENAVKAVPKPKKVVKKKPVQKKPAPKPKPKPKPKPVKKEAPKASSGGSSDSRLKLQFQEGVQRPN